MIRKTRLATGLILFAYLFTHLVNHALGLVSMEFMEASRPYFQWFWKTSPGTVLLGGAMMTHIGLALYALYRRRSFRRMALGEVLQLILGFLIPILLAIHIVGTRLASLIYHADPTYPWLLLSYFKYEPALGWRQAFVLVIAWSHACFGIYYWLRLKPFWPRLEPIALIFSVLVPVLALAGFWHSGQQALVQASIRPDWIREVFAGALGELDRKAVADLFMLQDVLIGVFLVLVTATIVLRFLRIGLERRHGLVSVRYDNGRTVRYPAGLSLLDMSRISGVPHASVCGGRGRCSTCRVRIVEGGDCLPVPDTGEAAVLSRIHAGDDVRLACQTIPRPGALEMIRLMPPTATPRDAYERPDYHQGRELEIAVLFADLRGFTTLSEKKLPYDVVFILNRYFDVMGRAIEEAGGHLDKFIGDGVMALFGIGGGVEQGVRQAMVAAQIAANRLDDLNETLRHDLPEPLRIGMGIHVGHAIVGDLGYGRATQLTAVGDTVNTASRIEAMSKDFKAQLVISQAAVEASGLDCSHYPLELVPVRGREEGLPVRIVKDARKVMQEAVQ